MSESQFWRAALAPAFFAARFGLRQPVFLVSLLLLFLIPVAAQAQLISFDPATSIPGDPVFTVDMRIECAGEDVKGIELQVAFDSGLLRLDAITPGPWYTGSGQPLYFFDYTDTDPQGVIHCTSAVLDGTLSGTGILAICHFTLLDFGVSPLVFQDVDVRGIDNLDLGFDYSTGDQIILDPVVAVQKTTFGLLKAIYR